MNNTAFYALVGCIAAFTLVAAVAMIVLCSKVGALEEEVRALRKSKNLPEIGRAHVLTPVTWPSRMPSSA